MDAARRLDYLTRHHRGPLFWVRGCDVARARDHPLPAEPVSILPHHAGRHDRVPGRSDPRPRGPIGWDAARCFSWAVRVEPVYAVPWLPGTRGVVFAARRPAWQLYPPHRLYSHIPL